MDGVNPALNILPLQGRWRAGGVTEGCCPVDKATPSVWLRQTPPLQGEDFLHVGMTND